MTPSRTREVAEELARSTLLYLPDFYRCPACNAMEYAKPEAVRHKDDCPQIAALESALHAAEERGRVAGRREALEEAAMHVALDVVARSAGVAAPLARVIRELATRAEEGK